MRETVPPYTSAAPRRLPGPTLIGAGILVLALAVCWPAFPATTGAALVALGATGTLLNQFQDSRWLIATVTLHVFTYVSLYLLFVGAVVHMALSGPRDGLTFAQGLDLGISAGLMTLAVRWAIEALGLERR